MKKLIFIVAFALTVASSLPAVAATESLCKGNANRATPPVVNNTTHIRNIVWHNMRVQCLAHEAQMMDQATPSTTTQDSSLSPQQVQP
jgi:hypothetical protein